ncbi:hypothetical protein, conserved [Eimeria maxima]|uniref:Uncharacterized protein n=1 Tax=Eimeria maxima TaxID=5804 RepID=U6MGP8_EIMMA|nr:hypothetical protein, conserved [Eimeria maxima]CDJ61619.1 hypothetical protein, conserved [Eimeria maxima]
MNGRWGDGAPVASSVAVPSPQRQQVCIEARAAAAWLWVQSEVAGAFERFSKDLQAIHSRGLNAAAALERDTAGVPGSRGAAGKPSGAGTARDALNSLLLLCSEAGAEADRFSATLRTGVLKPLEDALQPLSRAYDATGPPKAATHLPTECGSSGEVQKAARRLQLAEEELTKAEASLQELRSLFGSAVNSSLEQKAVQRISRASRLKVAAQEALQQALSSDASRLQQDPSSSASHPLASLELHGGARLLKAADSDVWAEAEGLRPEDHQRRISAAVLHSMRAAGKAALTAQQRSTGFVLHYVRDLQLFVAAEVAAASASGSFTGGTEQDVLGQGTSEELISRLYRQANGSVENAEQRTNEATLRNLLLHQEKQLQEALAERDELRQQNERQRKEVENQQREIEGLKRQLKEGAGAAAGLPSPRNPRQKVRKQVTIHLGDSDNENTWVPSQQVAYQGGGRGELQGRADEDLGSSETAVQLPAVKAGSAGGPILGAPDNSPPSATHANNKQPIEMVWVDVQLRYEAFLLSLRSLPLLSTPCTANELNSQWIHGKPPQWSAGGGEASAPSLSSAHLGGSTPRREAAQESIHWADPNFASSVAAAVEAAADATLPPFLVQCCRLAAVAAAPASPERPSLRSSGASRISVQQVQGQMLSSRRQQQQHTNEGSAAGPLEWKESDLQVLAYELLLLVAYHYSQYSAAAAFLADEEEMLPSSTTCQSASPEEQCPPTTAAPAAASRVWLPRKSLARAMSIKLGTAVCSDSEDHHQQQQQKRSPEDAGDVSAVDTSSLQQQPCQSAAAAPASSLQLRKPRKSLARAMSIKFAPHHEDAVEAPHPQNQQQQQQEQQERRSNSAGGGGLLASSCAPSRAGASPVFSGGCHPFSIPLGEWQQQFESRGLYSGFFSRHNLNVPRQRQRAMMHWLNPSPLLQQSNEEVLLQLLQLARVSFELPSSSSNKLLALLAPVSDSGLGPTRGTCLHPCDLRYRVFRLMEAWRTALFPTAPPSRALPRKQEEQQRQQHRGRFLHGAAAAAIGKLDASYGVRGALRRRAGESTATSASSFVFPAGGERRGAEGRRSSIKSLAEQHRTSTPSGSANTPQRRKQLAGDLGPPVLIQLPQTKRRSKRSSASAATATAATPTAAANKQETAGGIDLYIRQDPVFRSFIDRQLQLLHAAALSRCARLLKFLLPQGAGTEPAAATTATEAEKIKRSADYAARPVPSTPWRPVSMQQLYAREKTRSDEEALLYFLRSLLLCQGETASTQGSPQAPAFLLYSKEETAAAIAAAAQLQLLPLRLLCCFYHIFAYIFALQQLQRQQLWGEAEAAVVVEEVSIHVTDVAGTPAGTGEAEAPLTWEVRTEQRQRGGMELLQMLEHNMSQAAALDSALRCTLAARGNNNPTLKQLASGAAPSVPQGDAMHPSQRMRRQQSLKPPANLLGVPEVRSDCGDTADESDGSLVWGSDVEGVKGVGYGGVAPPQGQGESAAPLHLGLAGCARRSTFRRPTLKALRRRTLRTLDTESSAARAAAAVAGVLDGVEQKQQLLCLPREFHLSAYWCIDVPLLLSLLLLLARCCTDSTTANGLQLGAPSLVQGLLLVAHASQVGTDPTCPSAEDHTGSSSNSNNASLLLQACRAGSGFPGISLDSVSLLVAACVWATGIKVSPSVRQQQQQHQQQQQVTPSPARTGESADFGQQTRGSSQAGVIVTEKPPVSSISLVEQQQKRQLIQQLTSVSVCIVEPARVEVVSSALELLRDLNGFLKKPSAQWAEGNAEEIGWALGGSKKNATVEQKGETAASAAAGAALPVALPASSTGGVDSLSACLPATLAAGPAGFGALMKQEAAKEGLSSVARDDKGGGSGVELVELLPQVRGERLLLRIRASLLQQEEEIDGGLTIEPAPTFAGLLMNKRWLGADWWVSQGEGNGDRCQRALRKSQWAACCYGLSALLPSRVELQQQEVSALQLLGSGFLLQLQEQLQDYRRHFEPQALSLALALWVRLAQRLVLLPSATQERQQQPQPQQHQHWNKLDGGSLSEMGTRTLGVSSEAFSDWSRHTQEALQAAVDSGFGLGRRKSSRERGEALCGEDGERDGLEENVWVWGLPQILRGPSPLHDMLRCFVYRSLSAAAGRVLGPPVAALLQLAREEGPSVGGGGGAGGNAATQGGWGERGVEDQETRQAPTSSAPDAETRDAETEVETETDRVLCSLAQGINSLYSHVQSELLLYAPVFAPLLPLRGEQPLLVLAAAKAVLLTVLPLVSRCADMAAADPERKGLPAKGGRALLAALATFERLADQVCFGEVLCVSFPRDSPLEQQGLLSVVAPQLFASFSLHLSGLTDLLSQAFLRDVYLPANPPHAVYSEKAIDGWCCIYGVLEAALDSFLPLPWLIPRLLQFVSELLAALIRSLTDPCISQSEGPGEWGGRPLLPLLALRQLQKNYFRGLLEAGGRKAALSASPFVAHFLTLQRTAEERTRKQRRKSKGWRDRMTQLVGGWEEDKVQHGLQRAGSAYLSGIEDDNSGDSSDLQQEGGGPAEQGRGALRALPSRPVEEDKGRSRSVFRLIFGPNDSRESSAMRGGASVRGEVEGGGVGGGPTALGPPRVFGSGLERLSPAVCQLLSAVDALTDWEALRQKAALSGGQRPTSGLQRWLVRLHIAALYLQRLPKLREKLLKDLEKRILARSPKDVEVVQQLRLLQERGGTVGGTAAAAQGKQPSDLLMLRQQEELADLSAAVDEALEGLSQKLTETAKELCRQTVEAFFCAAPLEWQDELASAVLRCLVEAWCLLLADWGYGGHCYEASELEVLEADLDSLRQYAADNEVSLGDDGEMLDRVNDFLVMLDAEGRCLAAAEQLARQQQESPQQELSGDSLDRNGKT